MNEPQFIEDPWPFLQDEAYFPLIPATWIAKTWERNDDFRGEVIGQLQRSIEKTGAFVLAMDEIGILQKGLSVDRIVGLYTLLLESASRNEVEWRYAFEGVFPQSLPALPPIRQESIGSYKFSKDFAYSISTGNVEKVKYLVRCATAGHLDVRDMKIIDYGLLGLTAKDVAATPRHKLDELVRQAPDSLWPSVRDLGMKSEDQRIREVFASL